MCNKIRLTHLLFLVLAIPAIQTWAQEYSGYVSYELNADSTVTFTYVDSTALKVSLRGSCMLPKEDLSFAGMQVSKRMREVRDGVWQCTTQRALTPELYTYQLIVDGKRRTDPMNPDSIRVRNKRRSVLLIDGTEQVGLYKPAREQGRVEVIRFAGEGGQTYRMMVYLPYQYHDTATYPLLFLLHGINGDERNWVEQGRVKNILDNLIQQGAIRPVVVVMPRCLLSAPKNEEHVESTNVFNYGEVLRGKFEVQFYEIEQYVYAHYAVQHTANAIAGLSCGARQAANIANRDDSTYAYVGMFSPVVTKHQLPDQDSDSLLHKRYWVGDGKNDWMFRSDARVFARRLKALGVEYEYLELKGGHTFANWRVFVTRFMRWAFPPQDNNENKDNQ